MNFVDAHVHVWTTTNDHYPLAAGWKAADTRPRNFTPEDLFKHTRPAGVNRVNLIQISFFGFDNRYMLDMIRLHREVFVGTAVIDPLAKEPDRVMAEMAKQGVRAFRIHPRLSQVPAERWLEPAGYGRMFAMGAKHNLAMSCLIDPSNLPEVERMCKAHPDTPVIIDHLCRIGANGTIVDRDVDALCALAKHKRVLVKVGAFYALGKKQPPYTDLAPLIQRIVETFGPSRCMWESDSPFQVHNNHTYRDSIDLIRTRLKFLSDTDKDWLLRRTAEDFFFRR